MKTYSYNDDEINNTIGIVKGHLNEWYFKLGELLGVKITDDLKECINSIIVKTNQHTKLKELQNVELLQKSFNQLPKDMKMKLTDEE